MSVSSVALSSLATSPPAPTVAEGSRADRSPTDMPMRPAAGPSQDEQKPIKAAVPPTVGQAIDISA